MDLYQLSKTILLLNKAPINKVRFARVIYFVHKELIRKKFMSPEDIAYIRSPLGPIPNGMLQLALNHPSIVATPASDRPSFAAEEYTLKSSEANEIEEVLMLEQYREVLKATERTLKALAPHTTPELVQASHADPSWVNNFNGTRYFITPADLKNPFPFNTIRVKIRVKRPSINELGALQANLLRGMIQDIVKESTDLEYPDQPNHKSDLSRAKPTHSATKPKTAPSLNPLALIAALPFLKRPKPATKPHSTSKKSPNPAPTTSPGTSSANNQAQSSSNPSQKPEQNPNEPTPEQEGTKQ